MRTSKVCPEGDLEGSSLSPRDSRGFGWFSPAVLRLGCLLMLFSLSLPGCSGCRQDPDEETAEEEEEEEKPKEDFESGRVVFLPAEGGEGDEDVRQSALKPGHWGVLSQAMRANNFDFIGQLYVAPADSSQQEVEIEYTPYRLALRRPVSLPQGQVRRPSVMYFMPRTRNSAANTSFLRVELRTKGGGRMVMQAPSAIGASMPDHQYFMVVLAGRPNDYGYLGSLALSRSPVGGMIGKYMGLYRVVTPNVTRRVPLPDHPLAWTSIAYLVLDDFDPTVMTPAQEQAMIDWLHWGGQIIISGPRTLDRLKGTRLAEYLPAEGGSSVELVAEDYEAINEHWHLNLREHSVSVSQRPRQNNPYEVDMLGRPYRPAEDTLEETAEAAEEVVEEAVEAESETAEGEAAEETEDSTTEGEETPSQRDSTESLLIADGVQLELTERGRWVPHTGELVAEADVGRGRIVVTSFSLSNRALASYWVSRDSFFNGGLMGLPGREFDVNDNSESSYFWTGRSSKIPLDPRVISNLRFFSRDLGEAGSGPITRPPGEVYEPDPYADQANYYYGYDPVPREPENWEEAVDRENGQERARRAGLDPDAAPLVEEGWTTAPHSGVGGWYDFSATANAARDTLNEAAGIEVPSGEFVAKVLLGYIIVLVPVNWLLFRMIGRVELAWVAAPVIAIVGMVVVVRVAQLDIGFARSRTEVAVLELQPGHDRGHLTRYVGLYTSLSTGFSLSADSEGGPGDEPLLLPFAASTGDEQRLQTHSTVRLDRDGGVELNGMRVISASTGMVHIEQMLPMEGGLRMEGDEVAGYSLVNGTGLTLRDVGVVRRVTRERVEAAWVGELQAGATVLLEFGPAGISGDVFGEWNQSETTRPSQGDGNISLRRLFNLASDPGRLRVGDARLVGWYDEELAPIDVQPGTTQSVFRTMVVGNLAYGRRPRVFTDVNLPPVISDPDAWGGETMEILPTQQ